MDRNGKLVTHHIRVYSINQSSGESVIKPASQINVNPAPVNAETLLGGLTYTSEDSK